MSADLFQFSLDNPDINFLSEDPAIEEPEVRVVGKARSRGVAAARVVYEVVVYSRTLIIPYSLRRRQMRGLVRWRKAVLTAQAVGRWRAVPWKRLCQSE